MAEQDALRDGNFSNSPYLKDFPAKIRVLTTDPLVYNFRTSTLYTFVIFNLDENKLQLLSKSSGFANRFKEIHLDPDYGGDIRKIDLKITTNGKAGLEVRYTITPIGVPHELTDQQKTIIKKQIDDGFDVEELVIKKNPGALRLSEINSGKKLPLSDNNEAEPENIQKDVVIEDLGDDPIDLNDIPF